MSATITRLADFKPIKHKGKSVKPSADDSYDKDKAQEKAEAKITNFIRDSEKDYARLRKLGKKKGDYTEKDMGLMLKTMLKMTLKMLPQAQQTYVKWPNNLNAAAYNHLVSQGREIANDIRSIQDLNGQFETIMNSVTRTVQLMVRNLYDQAYPMVKEIKEMNPKVGKKVDRLMKLLLREHGSYAGEALKGLHSELADFMIDRK